MHRIDTSRAVLSRPLDDDVPASSGGYFTGGIPGVSLPTQLNAAWFNAYQENAYQLVLGARITPTRGPGGDLDQLNAVKTLHKPKFKQTMSVQGFIPGANATYDLSLLFIPEFPSLIKARSWFNSSEAQPAQVSPVWSIQNTLLINGEQLAGENTTLPSSVQAYKVVPADTVCTIVGRLVTASPGSAYKALTHYFAFEAHSWGEVAP